jgi:hypothetical protein
MVVDFSKVDMDDAALILRTNHGKPIGALGYASGVVAEICYNEVSKLTFKLPAYVGGRKTPHYDEVSGARIVDLKGVGQFILSNPKIKDDGVKAVKECTAYSLEYEFTYKTISLESATFNFWNPVAPGGTILDEIMDKMPSWSIGTVAGDLVGKYRTFDVSGENLYNFIKSTIQEAYQCVFEFDTYNRRVNVRSVKSTVLTEPVYISFDNLIKEAEIAEDSDGVVTCLDVSGAEGVDIRSVNPMGVNKIYNLDYFMNETNFTPQIIYRYNSWKAAFESYQLPYYNLSVESALKTTERLTESAALADLNGELKNLENQQAVIIQSMARGLKTQSDLNAVNALIQSKKSEINYKNADIASIDAQIQEIANQMIAVNGATSFSAFFDPDELVMLDKFIKEDSIADSSFVAPAVKNYNSPDMSSTVSGFLCSISGAAITRTVNSHGKDIYTISGGSLSAPQGIQTSAEIIKASYEVDASRTFLFTAYLKSGSVGSSSFPSGCLSLTGSISGATSSDVLQDPQLPQIYRGTRVSFTVSSARFYFTQNTTIYEQRSVEWDLYDYGRECLERLSSPSYTFSVSMADFLSLDEFAAFKKRVALGSRVYLRISEDSVLKPIAVKCALDFDSPSGFKFEFGNTYKVTDSEFKLLDILNQSISMGSRLDLSHYSYNAWVESGAETQVSQYMNSALDLMKNEIISSGGQAPSLNETGLRLRKLKDGSQSEYEPFEVWANNSSIMFTTDNWNTANLAIGQIKCEDGSMGSGVIADSLIGKLVAANSMIIESAKKDGGKSVFRVDSNGMEAYNAVFNLYNGSNTQITLNPYSGFAIGKYPLYAGSNYAIDANNAKFWVDMDGNVHIKGELHGVTGTFSGALEAATGRFKGVVQASDFQDLSGRSMMTSGSDYRFKSDYLDVKGLVVRNSSNAITFRIDGSGNVTMQGSITLGYGSYINWGYVNADPLAESAKETADSAVSAAAAAANNIKKLSDGTYSGGTFINGTSISAPYITGGKITGNEIYASYIEGVKIVSAEITSPIIKFGTWGTLQESQGNNGNGSTQLIEMYSSRGIRLYAGSGGLGLYASGEVWVSSKLNLSGDGGWVYDVNRTINDIKSRLTTFDGYFRDIISAITSLIGRVSALESKASGE